jgi:hypothetical protein
MGMLWRHNYFLRKNIAVCMQGNHFSIIKNGCAIPAQLFFEKKHGCAYARESFFDNEKWVCDSGIIIF